MENKTNINWFPGHMAKALRLIDERIHSVDFVIECRDARAPFSTRNPILASESFHKKRLVILTKKDLAIEDKTQSWIETLENEGHEVIAVDVLNDPIKKLILEKTALIMKDKHDRDKRRGIRSRASRALIVGVPNVGKSTVINLIGRRRAAKVENRPGVTQALKLIKVSDTLEIIDSPGVLWPKFETQEMGIKCALVGSIKETGYPLDVVSDYAKDVMFDKYNDAIIKAYSIEDEENFFEDLALQKGLLMKQGISDIEAARRLFVLDIQNGRLGPITWD